MPAVRAGQGGRQLDPGDIGRARIVARFLHGAKVNSVVASVKEIAREQGAQHDTVRKQLRSIYQETRTNRRPALVRLLLHLPHNVVQG